MRTRIFILIVALIIGGIAAVTAAKYITSARSTIEAQSQPVEVLVAAEDIPRGMAAEELLAKKMLVLSKVPQRFVAAGAISSEKALEGRVLAVPLTAGEQVTQGRFELPESAGLAYSIPANYMAISIPVDETHGVSGLLKPGDHIALYASFEDAPGGAISKLLVSDVKVLAVGAQLSASPDQDSEEKGGGALSASRKDGAQGSGVARTITIAIDPKDAERIVFAGEEGEIWCSLLPATAQEAPTGKGQTIKSVLK